MIFEKNTKLYSYEVRREGGENVAYVNYLGSNEIPNIAYSPLVMARVIDLLIESSNVSRIVLVQQRNYNYSSDKIMALAEIANLYVFLVRQERVLSPDKISSRPEIASRKYEFMQYFLN